MSDSIPGLLHVVADFHAKPGQEQVLRATLHALMKPTRDEIGCIQYDLVEDSADPKHFMFVERWASLDAHKAHDQTPHIKTLQQILPPLIEGEVKVWKLKAV